MVLDAGSVAEAAGKGACSGDVAQAPERNQQTPFQREGNCVIHRIIISLFILEEKVKSEKKDWYPCQTELNLRNNL